MRPTSATNVHGRLAQVDAGSPPTAVRTGHTHSHSMAHHMLLCAVGMVAAITIGAALGFNVAPLLCAAMMVYMGWAMAAPAVSKHRDGRPAKH